MPNKNFREHAQMAAPGFLENGSFLSRAPEANESIQVSLFFRPRAGFYFANKAFGHDRILAFTPVFSLPVFF